MFPPNTYLKILNFFSWPIQNADEVKTALADAEGDPDLEAEINDLITRLTALCQAIEESVNCGESAMTKMDVIEWDSTKRSGDAHQLKNKLTKQLANLLGLEWSSTTSCPGGATTIGIDVT